MRVLGTGAVPSPRALPACNATTSVLRSAVSRNDRISIVACGIVVLVLQLMLLVEQALDLGPPIRRVRIGQARERDRQLEALADIAHVDRRLERERGDVRRAFRLDGRPCLGTQLLERALQRVPFELLQQAAELPLEVVARIRDQGPERVHVAGGRRDHHLRNPRLARQRRRMHRAGAAEGDQHAGARVDAPLGRHQPDRRLHVEIGDAQHAQRRLGLGHAETVAQLLLERGAGAGDVELHLAADQLLRIIADHRVGVGDGGLRAAARIADRSRPGAGAARPHMQEPAVVHPGERAAAAADLDQIDHRGAHRQPLDEQTYCWS